MNSRRTLVGVLIVVALALVTLDFRDTTGPVSVMQRQADKAFYPVQSGTYAVLSPIGDFFSSILHAGSLRSQVETLQADNDELRQQLLVQAELERRLIEAEGLLNMAETRQLAIVGARVIATPPGTFQRTLLIDAGAEDGVAEGMAVINPRGVVGVVVEVTGTHSRVNLLSSTEGRIVVRASQTGATGLLTGQGSGLLQLEALTADPNIPLDAVFVTHNFQGSLIPGGLPVGVLEPPSSGQTVGERYLGVRPYVDFGSLNTVAVVIAGPEQSEDFSPAEVINIPNLETPPTVPPEQGNVPLTGTTDSGDIEEDSQ